MSLVAGPALSLLLSMLGGILIGSTSVRARVASTEGHESSELSAPRELAGLPVAIAHMEPFSENERRREPAAPRVDQCDTPVIDAGDCLSVRTVNVEPPSCSSHFLPYERYKFEVYSCSMGSCTTSSTDTLAIELWYGDPSSSGTLIATIYRNPVPGSTDKYLAELCYTGSTPPNWFVFSLPGIDCGTEWVKVTICCTSSCGGEE